MSSNNIILIGIRISFSSTAITTCSLNCLIYPFDAWRIALQWFELSFTASQRKQLALSFQLLLPLLSLILCSSYFHSPKLPSCGQKAV